VRASERWCITADLFILALNAYRKGATTSLLETIRANLKIFGPI